MLGRKMRKVGIGVLVGMFLLATGAGRGRAADPGDRLAALSWLEGTWRGAAHEGTWEARYTDHDGGLILSVNKQIVDGRVVLFEFERFSVEGQDVVLTPYPHGKQSPVVFTLTEQDATERRAVFENPKHDFPQRITYHRQADDRLYIGVHAEREGRRVGFDLNLARVD